MTKCLCQTHRPNGLCSEVFESTPEAVTNMLLQDLEGILRVKRDKDQVFITMGQPRIDHYDGPSRREPDHVLIVLFESDEEAISFEMFFHETQAGTVQYVNRPLAVL